MKMQGSIIAKMLRDAADKIENGTCGLDEDELYMASMVLGIKKMNIEQLCQHFGISRATLNRWQQEGKIPKFRKESGGKEYLFQEEAESSVRQWEEKHKKV